MSARFNFRDVYSNERQQSYGKTYTVRQQSILCGELPLDLVRLQELTLLVQKAESLQDYGSMELAQELYDKKLAGDTYFPTYSKEESMRILQSLTPWQIRWS